MRRRSKTRQRRQDVDVDLARIRLGCDRVGVLEPTQFSDAFVQGLYFLVVAVEEGQEAGLSTRGSLCPPESQIVSCPFEVSKVPKEFLSHACYQHTSTTVTGRRGTNLDPQRSSFSDGGELGRLVMRESERRHVFVLTCEVGESRDHDGYF